MVKLLSIVYSYSSLYRYEEFVKPKFKICLKKDSEMKLLCKGCLKINSSLIFLIQDTNSIVLYF